MNGKHLFALLSDSPRSRLPRRAHPRSESRCAMGHSFAICYALPERGSFRESGESKLIMQAQQKLDPRLRGDERGDFLLNPARPPRRANFPSPAILEMASRRLAVAQGAKLGLLRRQRSKRKGSACGSGSRLGGLIGLGTSPFRMIARRAHPGSGTGTAESSARCRGASAQRRSSALARLDDLAEIHHRDPVRHMLDDREVMADEETARGRALLEILQEIDDLRLDRDVERRDCLVADDEIGLWRERPRDADALTLAAGEFMREAVAARRAAGPPCPAARATLFSISAAVRAGRNCGSARPAISRRASAD